MDVTNVRIDPRAEAVLKVHFPGQTWSQIVRHAIDRLIQEETAKLAPIKGKPSRARG